METRRRTFSLWYFVAAFVAMLLIQSLLFVPHAETQHTAIFKMLLRAGKVVDVTIGQQVISADLTPTGLERLARLLLTREALDWTALEQAMQMSAPQAG